MKKKTLAVVLTLSMIGSMLAGCGTDKQQSAESTGTESNAAAEAQTDDKSQTEDKASDETASGDKVEIAVVAISATESNNARYIQGLKDEAEKKGYTITVLDANGSTDNANAAFTNFISKGSDAIIDMVFPATSLGIGLLAAKDADVPVLTWGGGLADGVYYTNGSGGPTAIDVIKQMCEDMDGKGEILALTYHDGQVAREREEEFDKILSEYPDITVTKNEVGIPGYYQNGMDYATAWLAGRPEGDNNYAVWGSWDDPALGALAAIKQMGRKDIKIYGQNGNADALQAIKDGWMTATAWQDGYSEGVAAVDAVENILKDKAGFEKGAYELPAIVVNADNIDSFIEEHPETIENVN